MQDFTRRWRSRFDGNLGEVEHEHAVALAGLVTGLANLEKHLVTVVTHDGLRCFPAGKVVEMGEALQFSAAVEGELVDVD